MSCAGQTGMTHGTASEVRMRITMPSLMPVAVDSEEFELTDLWVSPAFRIRGEKYRLVFEPGYRTDGAIIPRLFWTLVGHPLQTPLLLCALTHYGLCSGELCSRMDADLVLMALAHRYRIHPAKRLLIWVVVRTAGRVVWSRHTRESIRESRRFCRLAPSRWFENPFPSLASMRHGEGIPAPVDGLYMCT